MRRSAKLCVALLFAALVLSPLGSLYSPNKAEAGELPAPQLVTDAWMFMAAYKADPETLKALQLLVANGSKDLENALYACVQKQLSIGTQLGMLDGAMQESLRYKDKADKMREADEGNHVFSRQEFESAAKSHQDEASRLHVLFVAHGTKLGILQDNVLRAAKGSPKRQKFAGDFLAVLKEYMATNNHIAIRQGAANENFNHMTYLDKHIRAAGGSKSEEVLLESMRSDVAVPA